MSNSEESECCPNCGTTVPSNERYCPACSHDIGPPNIRVCGRASEIEEVRRRHDEALGEVKSRNALAEWSRLSDILEKRSGVVVAVPASIARNFISDPRIIYANYESLVGHVRRPASEVNDRHRRAVSALVFGGYGNEIRYGNLAIGCEALASYGDVAFRLRTAAVEHRTSFLETNSFDFAGTHGLTPEKQVPSGFRSIWRNRHELALAKLGSKIENLQDEHDWSKLLVNAHPSDRAQDDFVEAHVYGPFNVDAVETVTSIENKTLTREAKLDARLAVQTFQKRQSKT